MEPDKISGWLRAICVCKFDIDIGQSCEQVIPRGALYSLIFGMMSCGAASMVPKSFCRGAR